MKRLLLTLSLAALTSASFAQFHLGAGIAAHKYGDVGFHPALQVRAGFDFLEAKYSVEAGFNYSPVAFKDSYTISYEDMSTTDVKYVAASDKYYFNNAFVHLYRIFGDQDNKFRFFLCAGPSIDFVSIKSQLDGTPPSGYTTSTTFGNQSLTTIKIDLGLGGNLNVGPGKVYAELLLGLRANESDGQYIENPGVSHYGLTVGYKYYFGSNNY